jgi:hypothetical protein
LPSGGLACLAVVNHARHALAALEQQTAAQQQVDLFAAPVSTRWLEPSPVLSAFGYDGLPERP